LSWKIFCTCEAGISSWAVIAKICLISLSENPRFFAVTAQDEIPASQVQNIFQDKLDLIDEKIAQLHQIRTMLSRFTQGEACPLRKDCPIPDLNQLL